MIINLCNLDNKLICDYLLGNVNEKQKYDTLSLLCIQYITKYSIPCKFQKIKFDINDCQIHIGIVPKYKKHSEYRKIFISFNSNFYGISFNVIKSLSLNYAMVSYGSWNHAHKQSFPIILNKFTDLNIKHNSYKKQPLKQITIFIQNYCKSEYWFGWNDDDITIWMNREKYNIQELHKYIDNTFVICVKFHPKMEQKYVHYFKEHIHHSNIKYLPLDYSLKQVSNESYCCIVNSGFSAIELCILGTPMFYLNDYYSCIPMKFFGIKGFQNILSFTIDELPNQQKALDYFASQIFHVNEIPKIIFNQYIQTC